MTNKISIYGPVGGRLMQIIQHYKLNKNSFSVKIGLKANSLIVRIINDPKRGFTTDLLQRIAYAFPDINIRWLVTGEGKMLNDMPSFPDPKLHYIKYMKKDGSEPTDLLRINGYDDCDIAYDVFGDQMAPRFRGGDIVICKTIDVSGIVRFGESYVIFSHGVPMIRYIKNEIDSETIKLGVENTRYEDTTMRKADVERLCVIKGVIRRETF